MPITKKTAALTKQNLNSNLKSLDNAKKFDYRELITSIFNISYYHSQRILEKILDEFFKKLVNEFGIISYSRITDKNILQIKRRMLEELILYINTKMNQDSSLKNLLQNIEDYYKEEKLNSVAQIDSLLYDSLKMNIHDSFNFIEIFALTLISNKNTQSTLMKKYGIYSDVYKPKGKKIKKDIDLIYYYIPIMLERLETSYGIKKSGKSDQKAAVYETIKFLEKKGDIKKLQNNPEKIYKSWTKVSKQYISRFLSRKSREILSK